MAYQKLKEDDLVQIKEALAEPTVAKAISSTEEDYTRPEDNIPGKKVNIKLETRVFELCYQKYKSFVELAQAMGLAASQVYRVSQGKRPINQKFIIGAIKAFPEHKLGDLFYVVPGGSENTESERRLGSEVMLTTRKVNQLLGVHPNTVRNWSNRGILKSYRTCRRSARRFRREDVDDFLKKREIG